MDSNSLEILRQYVKMIDNKDFPSDQELFKYLTNDYDFKIYDKEQEHNSSQVTLLINNLLLVYGEIAMDLKEITDRVSDMDVKMSKLNSESYQFKKLNYFKKNNIKAKKEIEEFLINRLSKYIKERVNNKKEWVRNSSGLGKILDVLPYNYSYYKKYYDPIYDFSTESKFRFLLNHKTDAIMSKIELKKDNQADYFAEIDNVIKSKRLLEEIITKIRSHYRLKNREEIFKTLVKLYENKLYQSFINLAVIQLEGLFYDFCVVINDDQENDNMGTLSEKAEKVFKSNYSLWLSIYPYFAFDAPVFRNRIAHQGLWNEENLKDFANELILDLNSILDMINLPYIPPNNLLILFIPMRKKIIHLDFKEEDYKTILVEIFSAIQMDNKSFNNIFSLLKNRERKRELLEHYIIPVSENICTNLYEECCRLSKVLYDEKFWEVILKYTQSIEEHNSGQPYDFIDFVNLITNSYIGEFKQNTLVKEKCIEVRKELKRFNIK